METQQSINYAEELKQLKERSNYWRPKPGKYNIICLSEPVDSEFIKENGEVVKQWKLKILVDGGLEMFWAFPKSNTQESLRGQLIKLGAKLGTIKDKIFTVIIIGEGKSRRYTIPEAI